jgi:hypothetical protein
LASPVAVTRAESIRNSDGRPLHAGHAELPWPDSPLAALWHAITLLREYRGDGHIIALVANGPRGLEALITCAATGIASAPTMLAGCVAGAMTSGTQPPKA